MFKIKISYGIIILSLVSSLNCAQFMEKYYLQKASSITPNISCERQELKIKEHNVTKSGYQSWKTICDGKEYYCFHHKYSYFLQHPSQTKCVAFGD